MIFYAPAHHISLFYDFLYLNALLEPENQEVKDLLLSGEYTAFTDLATSSLNCQARSAAIFVGVQLLNKNKVKLFTPVVPCRFTKADVENYYTLHCYTLNNKKEADNYLDLRCG